MSTSRLSVRGIRHSSLMAAIVFLASLAAAAAVTWRLEEDRRALARTLASDQAGDHARALQARIDHALSATIALAAAVREGNGRIRDFDRTARELVASFPDVSAIQLAPGGVVTNSYPLAGNERAIGHDLFKDPERSRAATKARDSGQLTLAGPFKLVQGGTGAVGRLPVYLPDDGGRPAFWGFTTVLLRFPDVLGPLGLDTVTSLGLKYRLSQVRPETGERQTLGESSAAGASLEDPVVRRLRIADASWELEVAPVKGWADPAGLASMALVGLLLSALLATVTKLLLDLKSHQAGLEALVARRTEEVAARIAELDRAQAIAEVGSWTWDLDGETLEFTPQAIRMICEDGSEAPASLDAFLERIPAHEREAVRGAMMAARAGKSFDIEHRVSSSAAVRWIRHRSSPDAAQGERIHRISGTLQDVTRRVLAQQGLRAAEARYRGLVEQSLAGIYMLQDGRFVYVNPRAVEIFGYGSAEELMGVDPMRTAPEADHAMMREHRRTVLEGEAKSFHYARGAIRKDGSALVLDVTGTLATHEDRPAIIGMIQDISERTRSEEEIRRHIEKLSSAMIQTVEMATTMGEMRDPYTAGHQRRVAGIAVAIGELMGLDANALEGLRVAGYLHDVGKITIPAEILSKPGKLGEIEHRLIKGHCQAGHDVLVTVDFPWPVAEVALQHHERVDGSGYPMGLRGEEILVESRIIAVADVVEAMSTHRPYRAALGIEKALTEIERGRGTSYDAAVADACLRLFREKGFTIPG